MFSKLCLAETVLFIIFNNPTSRSSSLPLIARHGIITLFRARADKFLRLMHVLWRRAHAILNARHGHANRFSSLQGERKILYSFSPFFSSFHYPFEYIPESTFFGKYKLFSRVLKTSDIHGSGYVSHQRWIRWNRFRNFVYFFLLSRSWFSAFSFALSISSLWRRDCKLKIYENMNVKLMEQVNLTKQ